MYKANETEISYRYLTEVIKTLDDPICILGGWAVFFTVNKNFEKEKGYPYIGSRDIDLGFNNIKTLKAAILKLEKLGFKRLSFRMHKEIHSETMKELSTDEAKKTLIHNIFPMYVDLIVAKTDSSMKENIGFMPIDEPLLSYAFKEDKVVKEFGRQLILPSPTLLLATKINSIRDRDKDHKRIKDLCDITGLLLYSGEDISEMTKSLSGFCNEKQIKEGVSVITQDDIKRVSQILSIEATIIKELINKIFP